MAGEEQQLALDLYPDVDPETGRLWVRTPGQHAHLVHAGGLGCMSIAHKATDGNWQETPHPVEVGIELLKHCAGFEDVYLSTQRFRGRRRIAHLLSLGALYADVDYYQIPKLAGSPPLAVLEQALSALHEAGMPEPTLAIGSGRGLYLLWLHSPIPRAALPRWTACQKRLWEVLKPIGSDRAAIDAARVLRVIGTLHRTSGVMVEALSPVGEVWDFEQLATKILPLNRTRLADLRVQRALRRAQEPLWSPPKGFTQATLWEARLSDLQRLRDLRFMDYQMADYRDRWLFLAGVAMSWLAIPQVLQRELHTLARLAGGWSEAKTRSKMQAVFRTAHQAARGERVAHAGVTVDPRYRFRNQTIIELLEITPEEERQLTTIISDNERRRRDREEKRLERREAGAMSREESMSREEYEGRAKSRRAEVRRMISQGLRAPDIALALGISRQHVYKLLNTEPAL